MKTLKQHIFEKLKISKNHEYEFDELIALFRRKTESGDTFPCSTKLGGRPILHVPKDDPNFKGWKNYDNEEIHRMGFIEGNDEHGPVILFVIYVNNESTAIGVTNWDEYVSCIDEHWRKKIKDYLS
jgi:hypothetical protein